MKKLIGPMLALALCMTALGALAESVPSRTTDDLIHFTVTAENHPGGGELFLRPVQEAEAQTYQEHLDVCKVEIEKLAASESPEAYFGDVINMTDMSGKTVTLRELMVENELNVFEFCPLLAGGFHAESGKVTAEMLFSTPYEKDERVIVMIGIVTVDADSAQSVAWHAFEGIGLGAQDVEVEYAGRIQVALDPRTLKAVQDGTALLAIVSGEKETAPPDSSVAPGGV